MLIAKFVNNILLRILLRRTHFQGSVAVGNMIELLLSHIVVLEERFDSRPSDVAELRRRDELEQYVISPPLDLVLSSF